MTKKLYPLKFVPIPSERVWGSSKLIDKYHKPFEKGNPIGESWEIVGFEEDSSIVANGFLEKNCLFDILETYMGEIVGEDNYKHYGNEFPLLVKILDINDRLSVQVHPDDETAFDRHNSYGKNEAWYVLETSEDAVIYMGLNRDITPAEFYERCKNETIEEVLNVYHPKKGDFFYIEAGIVHSAGGGLVIAEVQQLSDVTYRIYDWGREHNPNTAREIHLDLAFDCINYSKYDEKRYFVPASEECSCHQHDHISKTLIQNQYFDINILTLSDPLHIYTDKFESFILYFCIEGGATITPNIPKPETFTIEKGEWVLIPASFEDFILRPSIADTKLLEVHTEPQQEAKDSYINYEDEDENEHDCLDHDCLDHDCGHHHNH